jgi:alcohol dehydrogenase (cytochrome c)
MAGLRRLVQVLGIAVVFGAGAAASRAETGRELTRELTPERLAASEREPQNWLGFFGNYEAWSYSGLGQVNRRNVRRLTPVWSFATGEKGLTATPLVVDGVMYVLAPRNQLFALDAASGRQIWSYGREAADGRVARNGHGLVAGHGMIYFGTSDHHLVAVDAQTGSEVWDVQIEDPKLCGCGPAFAPMLVKDKIVMGVRGEVAHRSYINAFDAKTGKLAWRFWTVPGPGEPGHDTWPEELWRLGGASTWYAGSYDPELNLIYWGVGNPAPLLGGNFPGTKLYTNALVALDADTGKLKWHFQQTPGDTLDLDSALEPILLDAPFKGEMRKLVVHPTKGGFTYVLDRVTGAYLGSYRHAETITWTKGLDNNGLPMEPLALSPDEEKLVCPTVNGSRAGNHSTYSPRAHLWINTSFETCAMIRALTPGTPAEGQFFNAGSQNAVASTTAKAHIAAFDPVTGERKWKHNTDYLNVSSLMSTAGDLVFGGDIFGNAWALDVETGDKRWSYNVGSPISAMTISYAVKGRQYVAVSAGGVASGLGLAMRLWPEIKNRVPPVGSTVHVFALPERGAR